MWLEPKAYNTRCSQAGRLGMYPGELSRLLTDGNYSARPWDLKRLAEMTETPEALWLKKADLKDRRAAVDAWWKGVKNGRQ